jgi:hypothetical protein
MADACAHLARLMLNICNSVPRLLYADRRVVECSKFHAHTTFLRGPRCRRCSARHAANPAAVAPLCARETGCQRLRRRRPGLLPADEGDPSAPIKESRA